MLARAVLLLLLGSALILASLPESAAAGRLPGRGEITREWTSPSVVEAEFFVAPQNQVHKREEGRAGGWLDFPNRYLGLFNDGDRSRPEKSCARWGGCPSGMECCCCGDECYCKEECSFQKCR